MIYEKHWFSDKKNRRLSQKSDAIKALQLDEEYNVPKHPSEARKMRAKQSNQLFVWRCLLVKEAQTVIVMPAPHGDYKSGISYSDAFAGGEIYAKLHRIIRGDLRTPELLGDDICRNLIVIGGKKANPIAKHFQALKHASLSSTSMTV